MKKILIGAALVLSLVFAPTTAYALGGSDSPTPYTVDTTGITLPQGKTFENNGHVNLRTTQGGKNIHFEYLNWPEDHPKKYYIGKNFIPWSAFGLTGEFCVSWVQIDGYNEHFGEGGQTEVCVGIPETPKPEPEFRWTSMESSPDCVSKTVTITKTEEAAGYYKGNDNAWHLGGFFPTGNVLTETREATAEECPADVDIPVAKPPVYVPVTCDAPGSLTIPEIEGVSYFADDVHVSSFPEISQAVLDYHNGKLDVEITARLTSTGELVNTWAFKWLKPDCTTKEPENPTTEQPKPTTTKTTPKIEPLANTGVSGHGISITLGVLALLTGLAALIVASTRRGEKGDKGDEGVSGMLDKCACVDTHEVK